MRIGSPRTVREDEPPALPPAALRRARTSCRRRSTGPAPRATRPHSHGASASARTHRRGSPSTVSSVERLSVGASPSRRMTPSAPVRNWLQVDRPTGTKAARRIALDDVVERNGVGRGVALVRSERGLEGEREHRHPNRTVRHASATAATPGAANEGQERQTERHARRRRRPFAEPQECRSGAAARSEPASARARAARRATRRSHLPARAIPRRSRRRGMRRRSQPAGAGDQRPGRGSPVEESERRSRGCDSRTLTTAPSASSASAQPDPADVSARRSVACGAACRPRRRRLCRRPVPQRPRDQHGRQGDQQRIPGRLEGDLPPKRAEPPEPEPVSPAPGGSGRGEHGEGEEDHDALERRPGAVAGWRPSPGPAPPRDPGWAPARRAPDRPVAVECPLGDVVGKLGRPWRVERVKVQRYCPGERPEQPAHLRPSRHLLDADADEDAAQRW